ncbi:MAG: hypothetical protein ACREUW_16145 [Burkholderiales bacterium]
MPLRLLILLAIAGFTALAGAADQNPTTIVTIKIPPPPPKVNDAPIGQILGGLRLLPPTGRRGTLQGGMQMPFAKLNDHVVQLTPGAVIYDQHNRMIVHGQIPTNKMDVIYTVSMGQVSKIYILKPDERARLEPWFTSK